MTMPANSPAQPSKPDPTGHAAPDAAPAADAAARLAQVPTADLPLATSIGTVGLFALDGRTVWLRAGGSDRHHPPTHHDPVTVNRITVDITARYRRDDHGTWQRLTAGYGDEAAYRTGTSEHPTRAVLQTVEQALAAAVTEWATANPLVLAAAQDADYARQITEQEAGIYKLADQQRANERRLADLERARQQHTQRWAPHLEPVRTVGSVAYGISGAHYIIWTAGQDTAWGTIDAESIGIITHTARDRLLDAIHAEVRQRATTARASVPVDDWQLTTAHGTTGLLDQPDITYAAIVVAEAISNRLGHTKQRVTAKAVAQAWSRLSRMRRLAPATSQPLAEALELLADPATVRAAGHAQLLRALIDRTVTATAARTPDVLGGDVPADPGATQTARLIRQHLAQRSDRTWSVTSDRATGQVTIHAPAARRDHDGHMDRADGEELARLLNLVDVAPTGVTVAAAAGHRREYIARAMNRKTFAYGTQPWT